MKKKTNNVESNFESKFLENYEPDKIVKIKDEYSIIDPMAKFHNTQNTLSYAE
jgi:hypothetical protein